MRSALLIDPGQSEIEQRLERLEREKVVVFAVREAMRAAPLLAIAGPKSFDRLAEPSFRAILTASIAAFDPKARPSAQIASDEAFAAASLTDTAHSAVYAAARAAGAAVANHAAAAAYAGYAAAFSSARAAAAETTLLREAILDLEQLERAVAADQLRATPLWPSGTPVEFTGAVDRLAQTVRQTGAACARWVDWYVTKIYGWPELLPMERDWALAENVH
ncbi:MAG: hypothetical protein AAF811_11515 [Pseudomonadota bacterium]